MTPIEATSILYAAKMEPIGLLLRTSDVRLARQKLYAARRAAEDPQLDDLQFRASPWPEEGDLIIVNRHIELPAGTP